jgi:DNA modification methylase
MKNMVSDKIQIEYVDINRLIPSEYNPRQASDKEYGDLKTSIERFGIKDPAIVNCAPNRVNVIIGGHFRVRVAKDLGYTQFPVVYVSIPDIEKEQELNLRLNKNLGSFDFDLLANFDKDMLSDVGFSADEMQSIFDVDAQEDGFNAEEEYNKITQAETKPGDLYLLGEHKLLCGDSTKKDDVSRLMDGKLADMVFTDPPYNVNYNYAKYEAIHKGRKRKFKDSGKIFNDNKTAGEFQKFLFDVFTNTFIFSKKEMSIYVCHATKTQSEFFNAFHDSGFHFSQTIIWLKERIILALGQDYHRIYEPIMFGWKEGENHYKNRNITTEKEVWDLDRIDFEERLDVWYLARDKSRDYEHPTQKPVRLPERAIKKNCPMGGILFEPFGGSGSTLIAADQLGRKCYAIELDPKYCDVIVKRYEAFSGKHAQKVRP